MGETLRKMNASLILQVILAESKEVFKGVQYGMESMGTEKILHSINLIRDRHKDWDTICLDQKNAFNLIKRAAICTKLSTHFPHVLNYFRTFYFNSASLLMSDSATSSVYEFFSCLGVQQGDPLGPFLFNLGSLDHMRRLIEIVDVGICPAFFDDINCVAPFDNGVAMLKYSVNNGRECGLNIQHGKTIILLGICASHEEAVGRKNTYRDILRISNEDADRCIKIHPDNVPSECDKLPASKSYGAKILGVPVGSNDFINDWLTVKILELKREAEQLLKSVTSVQVQWNLIYYCLRNKVNHVFRVLPPRLTTVFVGKFESLMKSVYENHVGMPLTPSQWTQVKLSFDEGGNGLGDAFCTSIAGFIASSLSCFEVVKEITKDNDLFFDESSNSLWITDVWESVAIFNNNIVGDRFTIPELLLDSGPQLQHRLTKLMDSKLGFEFHNCSSTTPIDRARKLSVKCSESGGFLRATPNPNTTLMSNDEWITSIRLRLGLPLQFIPHNCQCVCKSRHKVDRQGYHFFDCKNGGERFDTHNELCKNIFILGCTAGLTGKVEPLLNHASSSRRGDFQLHSPHLSNLTEYRNCSPSADVIGDVKVSFPCSATYLRLGSHSKEGLTALDAYKKKVNKYTSNNLDLLQGRIFIPVSFESFGRFHPSVKPLIAALCAKAAMISGVSKSVLCNYWINRISVILQKNIARMMLSRVERIVSKSMPLHSSNPSYCVPSYADTRHPRIRTF